MLCRCAELRLQCQQPADAEAMALLTPASSTFWVLQLAWWLISSAAMLAGCVAWLVFCLAAAPGQQRGAAPVAALSTHAAAPAADRRRQPQPAGGTQQQNQTPSCSSQARRRPAAAAAATAALLAGLCAASALPAAQAATYATTSSKAPWQLAANTSYAAVTRNNTAVYAPRLEFEVSWSNVVLIDNGTLWPPATTQPFYYYRNASDPASRVLPYFNLLIP